MDLSRPLDLASATREERLELRGLQANVLVSHGRDFAHHLFLNIAPGSEAAAAAFLASLPVTDAWHQMVDTWAVRGSEGAYAGDVVCTAHLTAAGMDRLGIPQACRPGTAGSAFALGMRRRWRMTGDAEADAAAWPAAWDEAHVAVMLADDDPDWLGATATRLLASLPPGMRVVRSDTGRVRRHPETGARIEPFGFREGISNPRPVRRRAGERSPTQYDDEVPLGHVLVEQPGLGAGRTYGTFLVYRVLEQDVRRFRRLELELAAALDGAGGDGSRAGAMVMGRFRDGTPLHVSPVPLAAGEPDNDFTYHRAAYPLRRCPVHAHIRMMNPRGTNRVVRASDAETARERRSLLVRRGMTYGDWDGDAAQATAADLDGLPEAGVGTLFQCVQSSIETQYETVQREWSRLSNYLENTRDPIAYTGHDTTAQSWPLAWDRPGTLPFRFSDCVRTLGGLYLYTPPIAFLREIGRLTGA